MSATRVDVVPFTRPDLPQDGWRRVAVDEAATAMADRFRPAFEQATGSVRARGRQPTVAEFLDQPGIDWLGATVLAAFDPALFPAVLQLSQTVGPWRVRPTLSVDLPPMGWITVPLGGRNSNIDAWVMHHRRKRTRKRC